MKATPKIIQLFLLLATLCTIQAHEKNAIHEETPDEDPEPQGDEDNSKIEENYVVELTNDNFESAFKNTTYWLVEFYAPWCGHCMKLMPKFNKAAEKNTFPNVQFGKVDCTKETKLADKYKIQGFPTILWMTKKDDIITFKKLDSSVRDTDLIYSFVKEELNNDIEVTTVVELQKQIKKERRSILIVMDKTDSHYDYNVNVLRKTSLRAGKENILTSNSQAIRNYFDVKDINVNFVVGFHNVEEGQVFFRFGNNQVNIEAFVKELVKERTEILAQSEEDKLNEILDGFIKAAILIYKNANDTYVPETIENTRKALQKNVGLLYSIHSHTNETTSEINNIAAVLRITPEEFPVLAILDVPENSKKKDDFIKYKLSGNGKAFSQAQVENYIDDFKNHRLVKIFASDPIPETRSFKGVETLVGLSIQEFVNTSGKDTLVSICTTLSYPCRIFTKMLERLAKRINGSTFAVGQIDYTNNEFEHLEFTSIPTVALFRDNPEKKERYTKEGIIYYNNEKFTTNNLLEFVEKNAFHRPQLIDFINNSTLNETERLSLKKQEEFNDSEELRFNLTSLSTENDDQFKTDQEVEGERDSAERQNREKSENEEKRQKELNEKKEREKREMEDEEPDLQEQDHDQHLVEQSEADLDTQLHEAQKGGMSESRAKKRKTEL